jgi:hypothetical protein
MAVTSLQGFDAPFTVVTQAKREPLVIPPIDVFTPQRPIVITRDQRFPVYRAVYWLASPVGRGRYAIVADAQGRVSPNMIVHRFHVGTDGVTVSKLNPDELDLSVAHIALLSQGLVRVDHLKDENGVELGLPSDAVRRKGDSFVKYKMGLLNEARLRQLQAELAASEQGRTLLSEWAPAVPSGVETALLKRTGKSKAEISLDRKLSDAMQAKVEKLADKVRAALQPEPRPEPKQSETRADAARRQPEAKPKAKPDASPDAAKESK